MKQIGANRDACHFSVHNPSCHLAHVVSSALPVRRSSYTLRPAHLCLPRPASPPARAALPQRRAHLAAPVPPLALTARPLERRFPRRTGRWSSKTNSHHCRPLHTHARQQRPTPTPSPSSSSTTATAVPGRSANSPSVNSPHISIK